MCVCTFYFTILEQKQPYNLRSRKVAGFVSIRAGQQRQGKDHRQAIPLVDRAQIPFMKTDNALGHGQPDAEAVFFRAFGLLTPVSLF